MIRRMLGRAAMSEAQDVGGDWAVKGLDFDTYLVGAITDKIIDADRLARREMRNGFPNWALYRTFLCGDHHLRILARDWCVAYAIAAAESGVVSPEMPAEEMGCLAGWDAYYRLHNLRWLIAGHDVADIAGVDPKTYRKLRNHVYRAMRQAMDAYFVELQIAIRRVWKMDRWEDPQQERGRWSAGRGFHDLDLAGDGNYRAGTAEMSDNLKDRSPSRIPGLS